MSENHTDTLINTLIGLVGETNKSVEKINESMSQLNTKMEVRLEADRHILERIIKLEKADSIKSKDINNLGEKVSTRLKAVEDAIEAQSNIKKGVSQSMAWVWVAATSVFTVSITLAGSFLLEVIKDKLGG